MSTGGNAKRVTPCPTCEGGKKKAHQVACPACWRLVPEDLQGRIYTLFEKDRGSPAHLAAIKEGLEAIRAAQANHQTDDTETQGAPGPG